MERRFQKRRVLPDLSTMFFLEELTQIEWSISKKQKNGRFYETNIEDKEHHFDYCFEFDTNAKSRVVRLSFNRLSKFKKLPVVFITIDQKEKNKNVCFGNFSFHWLEIEQIEKILIEIAKFEFSIEKKYKSDNQSHLSL